MSTMTSTLSLTRLEARWASLVLPSFAGTSHGFTVGEGEVDYLSGLARFMGAASQKAQLGVRFAFLLAVTTPLWIGGRLRGFASMSLVERSELLEAMSRHRIFLVRELCLLLKLIACMAIFRVPQTRARSGYDGADGGAVERSRAESSARRGRIALPVLGSPALGTASVVTESVVTESGERAVEAGDVESREVAA